MFVQYQDNLNILPSFIFHLFVSDVSNENIMSFQLKSIYIGTRFNEELMSDLIFDWE